MPDTELDPGDLTVRSSMPAYRELVLSYPAARLVLNPTKSIVILHRVDTQF